MKILSNHETYSVNMDTGTKLAFERTYLAQERTQMAWVRTALSLIGFGFAIAKFFEYLHQTQGTHAPLFGARTVGLTMIVIGVGSLVLAGIQQRRFLKSLREQCPDLPASLAGATGAMLAGLGLLALVAAILRLTGDN